METPSGDADSDAPNDSIGVSACNLFELISNSADKLFFVCYTPADTLRPRWYLVQVSIDDSPNGINTGVYFCSFFQNHTLDHAKPDSRKRW